MDVVSYTTKDTFEQIIKCNGKKHNIVTIKMPLKKIYSRPDILMTWMTWMTYVKQSKM